MSDIHLKWRVLAPVLIATAGLGSGCASVEEGVAEALSDTRRAVLTGSEIVGNGDPDGYARAELSITDELNQICYDVNDVRGLAEISSVMIHRGQKGRTGPAVMTLRRANEGGWKNCVGRTEWLEDSLERAGGAYYIQIHTLEYPNGAIRGQFF